VQFEILLRFPERATVAFDLFHHPAMSAPENAIGSAPKAQLQRALREGACEAHLPFVVSALTRLVALLRPKPFKGG
jgi:hypothetical protein